MNSRYYSDNVILRYSEGSTFLSTHPHKKGITFRSTPSRRGKLCAASDPESRGSGSGAAQSLPRREGTMTTNGPRLLGMRTKETAPAPWNRAQQLPDKRSSPHRLAQT